MQYEKIFRKLIIQAIENNATDIHLEISKLGSHCEFRTLQGLIQCENIKVVPELFAFIKYRSNLDLYTDRKPQSGRIVIRLLNHDIYLRVAHFKNYLIETMVLRILNPQQALSFETLFNHSEQAIIHKLISNGTGLILFAGSTGSGKSTSLFTMISHLKHQKIYAIEDPVEFYYPNMVQLEINPSINFDFEAAIKQVLRHDPNVIIIGEIRDEKEAKAAIRCAYSGHLVLSTIHANDVHSVIGRLENFNINKQEIKQVLNGIIYQKLRYDDERKMRYAHFEIITQNQIHEAFESDADRTVIGMYRTQT